MQITFPCRYCASSLQADAALAGKEVFCSVCRSTTRVPEARLGPGVILGGFRIRRLLGTGLQSQVYLARQLSMGRDAALKIFLPAPGQPAEETAAVARARKAARLDHPHLPTIYEIGRDGAYRFVAEAFIPGEDLGRRLRRGRIPAAQALVWIGQAALALRLAWDAEDLAHGALHPANLRIDRWRDIRVLDLGLVRPGPPPATDRPTPADHTALYLSPEQRRRPGRPPIPADDIYALGALLYHAVTGSPPVPRPPEGAPDAEPILPHPQDLEPDLSPACVTLIGRMLARDPAARFPDWPAVIEALESVWRERTRRRLHSWAAPHTWPRHLARRLAARRPWSLVALVAIALLLLWLNLNLLRTP